MIVFPIPKVIQSSDEDKERFDIRIVDHCFKIPLTNEQVRASKLRFAIVKKSKITPLAFNCSYANSVINKNEEFTYNLRNPLTFADSAYKFCRFHLHLAESTYSCGIQNN